MNNFQMKDDLQGKQIYIHQQQIIIQEIQFIKKLYDNQMSSTLVQLFQYKSIKFVVKRILKRMIFNDLMRKRIKFEMETHVKLNHQNITQTYGFIENEDEFVLFLEYLPLAEFLDNKIHQTLTPIKSEKKLQSYMRDILNSIQYLNQKGLITLKLIGYVHCDIKISNIFMVEKQTNQEFCQLKIGDFGLVHQMNDDNQIYIKERCGTFHYIAPEVKSNSFVTAKIDMWSLGILLYKLCVAYDPTQINKYQYNSGLPIPFRKQDWALRTPELMNLIQQLLQINYQNRINVDEAIAHPWFQLNFDNKQTNNTS